MEFNILDQNETLIVGIIAGGIVSTLLSHFFDKVKVKVDSYTKKSLQFIYHIAIVRFPEKVVSYAKNVRNYFRGKKLNKNKLFRKTYRNQAAVHNQTIKAYSYFLLFWVSISFYLLLLVLGTIDEIFKQSLTLGIFSIFPIYLFQIMWLLASLQSDKLIKAHARVVNSN